MSRRLLVVAMNYAPERSGTAPFTTQVAEHFAQRFDVQVLAGVPHYPQWRVHEGYRRWTTTTREGEVQVRRLRHVVPRKPTQAARLAHELSFVARVATQRTQRPDAVIAVSPPLFGALAAGRLARRLRVPFGIVVQDLYSQGVKELSGARLAAGLTTRLERAVLQSAQRVLVIHGVFRERVTGDLRVPDDRTTTVFNWAQLPRATSDRESSRRRLGWSGKVVALHAGNMGAKQGLENVVDAARLAARQRPHVHFVLLGGGHQLEPLRARGADCPNLQLLPTADDEYADILAAADILLVNERSGVAEMSVPSKIASYCAAGRPIVGAVGPQGAAASLLTTSGAGVLVEPGRPDALLAAVDSLASDHARCAELSRAGADFAQSHLGRTAAMAAYDRWVDELLNCKPSLTPTSQ